MPSPVLGYGLFAAAAERRLAKRLSRIPPVSEDQAAHVRWGGPGDMGEPIPWNWYSWARDEPEPGDGPGPGDLTQTWDEVGRETEEVRVENPEDSEVYVMVERIRSITFASRSDPGQRKFVLKW